MSCLFYALYIWRSVFDLAFGPPLGGRVPYQTMKAEWDRVSLGKPHKHWMES